MEKLKSLVRIALIVSSRGLSKTFLRLLNK
jgi:hypothetical protein